MAGIGEGAGGLPALRGATGAGLPAAGLLAAGVCAIAAPSARTAAGSQAATSTNSADRLLRQHGMHFMVISCGFGASVGSAGRRRHRPAGGGP
jgi:hypothetical protein